MSTATCTGFGRRILTDRTKKTNSFRGILCILLAAFFFALLTVFIKLAGDVPTIQKSLFRNLIAAVFAAAALLRSKQRFSVRRDCVGGLVLRSLFGTLGILCNFWAVDHMILSDANMLNKLSPFFAIIMSVFLLKEIPEKIEWIPVIAAFAGALFVIRPTAGIASLPALVGLAGGFFAGTAYTFVRKLGMQGERSAVIVLFFSVFSLLTALPFVLADYHPMTLRQTLMLLCAGLSAAGGQFSITAAYRYAPAREISVFDYSQILWASLLGFLIFGTVPDALSVVGYGVIISAALIRWRISRRLHG